LFDVVGNIPQMAMRTIELIEEFYENTMATPTHICQYKVSDDKKWIEDVVKKY
jgi:singapore isolate B (sub-type 7) whole genome shotgun sequence assembly, scaffold_2